MIKYDQIRNKLHFIVVVKNKHCQPGNENKQNKQYHFKAQQVESNDVF